MVRSIVQVFSTSVYALLDSCSTLFFITRLLPKVLHDPIVVGTPLGENIRTDKVYKDCPIVVGGKTMCADLVELPMNDFDVML